MLELPLQLVQLGGSLLQDFGLLDEPCLPLYEGVCPEGGPALELDGLMEATLERVARSSREARRGPHDAGEGERAEAASGPDDRLVRSVTSDSGIATPGRISIGSSMHSR